MFTDVCSAIVIGRMDCQILKDTGSFIGGKQGGFKAISNEVTERMSDKDEKKLLFPRIAEYMSLAIR